MANEAVKGIWELRRDVERKSGRPVEIYSAYPLIGRGSIHHNQIEHDTVERNFTAALSVPWWKRAVAFINRKIVNA